MDYPSSEPFSSTFLNNKVFGKCYYDEKPVFLNFLGLWRKLERKFIFEHRKPSFGAIKQLHLLFDGGKIACKNRFIKISTM